MPDDFDISTVQVPGAEAAPASAAPAPGPSASAEPAPEPPSNRLDASLEHAGIPAADLDVGSIRDPKGKPLAPNTSSKVGKVTEAAAAAARKHLVPIFGETVGNAVGDLISAVGPHTPTEAALMLVTSVLPAAEGLMPALDAADEASPAILRAVNLLKSPVAKAAARTGVMAGTGAITNAIEGQSAAQGAEQGGIYGAIGEVANAAPGAATDFVSTLQGKPALAASAQQAAQSAEKEATIAGAKLATAAQEAATTASQETPELIAGAKQSIASRTAENEEATQKAIDKAAQVAAPDIRDRVIQGITGRTPAETEAAIHAAPEVTASGTELPGPEVIARKRAMVNAAFSPTQKMQDELGAQYDAVLGPHLDKPVADVGMIGDAAAQEDKYATDNGVIYSAPIRALLQDAHDIGGGHDLLAGRFSPEDLQSLTPRQRQNLEQSVDRMLNQKSKATTTSYVGSEGANRAATPMTLESQNAPTVARLRGLRSRASALTATSTEATDKAAAASVRSSVESALEGAGIPGVKELNAKYATFKSLFGRDFYREIAKAKDPIDAAATLFNEPQRSARIVGNATPEQRDALRQIYGDWVNRDGGKVVDYKAQKPVLERLFPGTKLADPKSWVHLPDKLVTAQQLMDEDPAFQHQVGQLVTGMKRDMNTKLQTELLKDAQKLGPAGRPIIEAAAQAKTPDEAVAILTQGLMGMTPEQAAHAASAAVMQRGAGLPTPEQAAHAGGIAALQAGKMDQQQNYMITHMKRYAPLYAGVGGLTALMGHEPSTYITAMGLTGLGLRATDVLKRSFVASLKDPANAEKFWMALQKPATNASRAVFARSVTRLIGDAATNAYMGVGPDAAGTGQEQGFDTSTIQMPASGPQEPPPPTMEPLPSLAKKWADAADNRKTREAADLRKTMTTRLKVEWPSLDPATRAGLAPILRRMYASNGAAPGAHVETGN